MKRITSIFLFFLFWIPSANAQKAVEQIDKRTVMVTAGVGLSSGFTVLKMRLTSTSLLFSGMRDGSELVKLWSTPAYNATLEKRVEKQVSLGGAFSYQVYHVGYRFLFEELIRDNNDFYTRYNFALRILLHLSKSKNYDPYFAFRPGVTFWTLKTSNASPAYFKEKSLAPALSFQVVYGLRFFYENLGFGVELAAGSAPYILMGNLCYRFAPD